MTFPPFVQVRDTAQSIRTGPGSSLCSLSGLSLPSRHNSLFLLEPFPNKTRNLSLLLVQTVPAKQGPLPGQVAVCRHKPVCYNQSCSCESWICYGSVMVLWGPGNMADQGVAFLACLAKILTEKLLWQNLKELLTLHTGKIAGKGKYKKVSSCIFIWYFFPDNLQSSEFLVTPKFGVLLRIRSNWAKLSEFAPKFGAPRLGHQFCSLNGWKILSRSWDMTKWRCLQKTLSARTILSQNVVGNSK